MDLKWCRRSIWWPGQEERYIDCMRFRFYSIDISADGCGVCSLETKLTSTPRTFLSPSKRTCCSASVSSPFPHLFFALHAYNISYTYMYVITTIPMIMLCSKTWFNHDRTHQMKMRENKTCGRGFHYGVAISSGGAAAHHACSVQVHNIGHQ